MGSPPLAVGSPEGTPLEVGSPEGAVLSPSLGLLGTVTSYMRLPSESTSRSDGGFPNMVAMVGSVFILLQIIVASSVLPLSSNRKNGGLYKNNKIPWRDIEKYHVLYPK
jgi:hypothetical protein